MRVQRQQTLFEPEPRGRDKFSSTFADNLSLPIHRWFRYSAGFSADWVQQTIRRELANGRTRVLDPFAGSGTVPLEAEFCHAEAIGLEAHPFVARIAKAKLAWRTNPQAFFEFARSILAAARKRRNNHEPPPGKLQQQCFPDSSFAQLRALRMELERQDQTTPQFSLTWLALASILRSCSPVGTAQWTYVLPRKSKARSLEPFEAFEAMIRNMRGDMASMQENLPDCQSTIVQADARSCESVATGWADLVLTSPPYANNYDYADATRLEMTFFGEIERWGCLQDAVRQHLVRSCTQHVSASRLRAASLLEDPLLAPIHGELTPVVNKLATEKEHHGGKKAYDAMVTAYFHDLSLVWTALRRVTKTGGLACFVIGDSAPYGVYVPVDRWLGELALAAGFKSFRFEKTRNRNVKWKNRKHRVPLHEGRLWVQG